ncbi:immunity 22 family protein [Salmonella enterica]|uniref:immunity 22 family protein n=1 Tax=Salmonella enterica TaxID=28901 RepID=UPI0013E97E63|nr:immunity 22 family protein [Salmonella enterica]
MQNTNRVRPVSVWMGVADENFAEYINQDRYGDACGFCQDIGQKYDVDIVSIYVSDKMVNVKDLMDEVPFSECFENEIIAKCQGMGLFEANACISIMNEKFSFPADKYFSGLHFIGVFSFSTAGYW